MDSAIKILSAIPHLRIGKASEAIDFYKSAFGATELFRLTEPSGRIGHAEIQIGGATVMLADEFPEYGLHGPMKFGGTTFAIHLQCNAVDALVDSAVQAGATVVRPAKDEFYGDRTATIRDPFGHEWYLAETIEKVSPEEMHRRFNELVKGKE